MSALRSALDEMVAEPDEALDTDQLDTDIIELIEAGRMVEVLIARKVASLARRAGHVELGYSSPTAYLMHRGTWSAGRAHRAVADSNAAWTAPSTHKAWEDGRLSTDQARLLFRIADGLPDEYQAAEERLTEIVEPLSVRDTAAALEYWRQAVDGPGTSDLHSTQRGLSLTKCMNGMRRVDGWLTPLAGETLETALDALMPPPGEDDGRTPRQRRHDALEDLARGYLDSGHAPLSGGEKPHLTVMTDLDALRGVAGGTHETSNGDVLTVDEVRRMACDASFSRIVLGPDSEVLDIGRKTRVWTAAQRRAIVARDRTCTWHGCERPAKWADIHHIEHWADGGTTSVENGALLCRFHHVLTHIDDARVRRRRTSG